MEKLGKMRSNKRFKVAQPSKRLAVAEIIFALFLLTLLGRDVLLRSHSLHYGALQQAPPLRVDGSSSLFENFSDPQELSVSNDQDYKFEKLNTPDSNTRGLVCEDLKVHGIPTLEPQSSFDAETEEKSTPGPSKSNYGAQTTRVDDLSPIYHHNHERFNDSQELAISIDQEYKYINLSVQGLYSPIVHQTKQYKFTELGVPDSDAQGDFKAHNSPFLGSPHSIAVRKIENATVEPCKSSGVSKISQDNYLNQVRHPGLYKPRTEGIFCNRSNWRTNVCAAIGETVMIDSESKSIILNTHNQSLNGLEEKLRPYPRKFEQDLMEETVTEIKIRTQLVSAGQRRRLALETCQVRHRVPAVVFSTGGYAGNLYHDMNDGVIPLFITTQHLKGEVVIAIVDQRDWWVSKYREILKQLTNYEIINMKNETRTHCFPEITVGLFIHGELSVNSSLMPCNESLRDFRRTLSHAYYSPVAKAEASNKKPQLVILVREKTRKILNLQGLASLIRLMGFRVWETSASTELKETFRVLNSSDAVMGVHGAELTHMLFMKPGSVLVQIIPFGLDWPSETYYEEPARRLGLQYLGYRVGLKESSLSEKHGVNDTVVTDPSAVYKKGWWAVKKAYLDDQDVRIDLSRMIGTIKEAKRRAVRFKEFTLGGSHARRRTKLCCH